MNKRAISFLIFLLPIANINAQHIDSAYNMQDIIDREIKPFTMGNKGKADWQKIESNIQKYGVAGRKALESVKPDLIFSQEIEPLLKANKNWTVVESRIKQQEKRIQEESFKRRLIGATVLFYLGRITTFEDSERQIYCDNLCNAMNYDVNCYPTTDPGWLNQSSWVVFERCSSPKNLEAALKWSQKAIELDSLPTHGQFFDTYANLLFKIGHKEEALQWQKKALDIDPHGHGIRDNYEKMLNDPANKSDKKW